MKTAKLTLANRLRSFDPFLLFCTGGLSLISLLMLWGGKDVFGIRAFIMQLAMTVLGIFCMVIVASLDYEFVVEKYHVILFIGSAIFLASTVLLGSAGMSVGTNKSWLDLKIVTIQPSEFVKATYILTFAKHLSEVRDTINSPKTLLRLGLHAGLFIGIVLVTGDLGVALVYVGITAVMLFCAGLSIWYFVAAAVIVLLVFPYAWELLEHYQQKRILVGFNPDIDPADKGRQAIVGRQAIINGGLGGCGIDGGYYYMSLPVASSDFAFATVCEKFGFIGGFGIIFLIAMCVIRIFFISK
ncbi:MAG: FtsW/RodA/SpoVE family cell cycle protein [Clostridia bacterium]|nr:FtsW/RodA/SpoVE family cell cycle protein [Clostridia bacterium]